MTLRYHRLKSPSFDMEWCNLGDKDHVLILAGGGGSTKSGVKNQIQMARVFDADKVELMDSYITDDEKKSRLCCGIGFGLIKNMRTVCALLDSDCLLLTMEHSTEGAIRLTRKVEFAADFAPEESAVNCCYIANSGHVVTGGEDAIIRVWEVTVEPKLAGKDTAASTSGDLDSPIGPWKVNRRAELRAHQGAVMAFSAHPTRNWLCSASKDGSCKLWDLENKCIVADIPCCVDGLAGSGSASASSAPTFQCRGCSFSLCGRYLFTVQSGKRGSSHAIKWALETEEVTDNSSTNSADKKPTRKVTLVPTPDRVALVSKVPCTSLKRSADGMYIAVGASDGSVTVLDAERFSKVVSSKACHDLPVTGLSFVSPGLAATIGVKTMVLSCSPDRVLAVIKIGGYSLVFKGSVLAILLAIVAFLMLYSSAVWLVIADSIAGPLR